MENHESKEPLEQRKTNWSEIIADFVKSGLRQIDYCKQQNLKPENLSYYYLKWKRAQNNGSDKFIPVKVTPSAFSALTLSLPGGSVLTIPLDFSPSALEKALVILRKAGC